MKTGPSTPAAKSWTERLRGIVQPGNRWFPVLVFAMPLAIGLLIGLAWVAMHRVQPAPTATAAAPVTDSQHPPLPAPTAGDLSAMPTPKPGAPHIVETTPTAQPAASASVAAPAATMTVAAVAGNSPVDEQVEGDDPLARSPEVNPYLIPLAAGDTPAQLIKRTNPDYPVEAQRANQEGKVMLQIAVDAQGRIRDVSVSSSSRSRALDRAAVIAARKWEFRSAIHAGHPVPSMIEVPVEFRLEDR